MMTKYKEITIDVQGTDFTYIERTNDDGSITSIPMNENNSDYQAYLNKDKAEQSTPMVADE
jgi:hypothetical protein